MQVMAEEEFGGVELPIELPRALQGLETLVLRLALKMAGTNDPDEFKDAARVAVRIVEDRQSERRAFAEIRSELS